MKIIPCYTPPFENEMIISWLSRLAEENAMSLVDFISYYGSGKTIKTASLDIKVELWKILNNLNGFINLKDFYLNHSTYRYDSIAMTKEEQLRWINSVTMPINKLNTPINSSSKDIKVCPVCINESTRYLDCMHQLDGVITCYKHKCLLQKATGTLKESLTYTLHKIENIESSIDIDVLNEYTDYATALYKSGLCTDIKRVKAAILGKIKELGYSVNNNYKTFLEYINSSRYAKLFFYDIVSFLKIKLISAQYISMAEIMPFLLMLYPDVNDFIHSTNYDGQLLINNLCNNCENMYISTSLAKDLGWGCPFCIENQELDNVFKNIVNKTSDSSYTIDGKFETLDKPVSMLHHTCGKYTNIKPRGFLFEGIRCNCENLITFEKAKQLVEANDGFELIEFTNTSKAIKVKHLLCNRDFSCGYHKFLNFPSCRCCEPSRMTTELFCDKVKKLTNGQYEVLGEFIDQDTKVAIKHKECGCVQEYFPRHFLSGFRCHYCDNSFSNEWNKAYELLKEYIKEYNTTLIPKRDSYKGFNLGYWCQTQRNDYKAGVIYPNRKKLLNEIGFVWDVLEYEWNRKYNLLKEHINATGCNPNIPKRTVINGENIGVWLYIQKNAYKDNKLTEYRYNKLIELNIEL